MSRRAKFFFAIVLASVIASAVIIAQRAKSPPLERMLGQMLMLGFRGDSSNDIDPQRLAEELRHGRIGGVLMLGPNFSSREKVEGLTRLFRKAAARQKYPPFLPVDMEGGLVQRLGPKLGFEALPSAESVGASMTVEEARHQFRKAAVMTRTAGFNMNLAPVVDLASEPANPLVATHRTYNRDPAIVTAYARAFIEEQRAENILPVLKHFPGHGSSREDTHDALVNISATWRPDELEPFRALIKSGDARAIMTGHLLHEKLAPDHRPVSLSAAAINGGLRRELKFDGLVISDDLQMSAVEQKYGLEEAVILAVNAGTDVLVIVNSTRPDPNLPAKMIAALRRAVADGRVKKSTIDDASRRIVRAKSILR